MHWADVYAEKLEKRAKEHVIETGTSISGIPHIGNASDVIRGDAIRKALEDKGIKARLIWVADDSDPFRKTPAGLEHLKEHLGKPVYDVPDPEGDPELNFVKRFALPFIDDLKKFGVEPKVYSGTELYREGELLEEIHIALEKRKEIVKILNKFRKLKLDEDTWFPWSPICENCGKISTTHAKEWDGANIVSYRCTGVDPATQSKDLKDITGCSHRGESDITDGMGKLPWRVEWAARWHYFKVTCEPFGKDHAAAGGSYDTSKLISKKIFGWDAPEPVVYEFLTLNGAKISSSAGNVITLNDWNNIAEPEVLKFFMYKRLEKQRDIDLSKIPNLTDEYDEAERVSFQQNGDEKTKKHYLLSQVSGKPRQCQVPFTLCAVLSQIVQDSTGVISFELYQKKVEVMGYKPDKERLKVRVNKAGEWVPTGYCPEYLKFDINKGVKVTTLSEDQQKFLKSIPAELDKKWTPEDFHKRIYEISREIGLKPAEAFKAIYLVLIGKERGPKAASFILSLDREFVEEKFS